MRSAGRDLDDLRSLKEDWDSYGAKPISEEAIHTADALCFVPSSDGGIDLELHAGGVELGVEISPDGAVKSVFWEIRA